MSRLAVLGAGAWGTALASLYARAGHAVTLHGRDPDLVAAIGKEGRNDRYLPGIDLPAGLAATTDAATALAGATIVLLVVPAQALRSFLRTVRDVLPAEATYVLCAKGIERETGCFASAVFAQECPGRSFAVLSGPSFAADVARALPTAVTIAAPGSEAADALARQLSTETFRGYASGDVAGVEAGGALKNVLALAAGAVAGRGLGASAQAAMITRGFVELQRLGAALGGRPETLTGLSGLGDLILTCSSAQSRNFAYGAALGRGDALDGLKLAEGVFSASVAARLAEDNDIDTPIIRAVADVLAERTGMDEAVRALLARPLRREAE